jgi:hypothetical protein
LTDAAIYHAQPCSPRSIRLNISLLDSNLTKTGSRVEVESNNMDYRTDIIYSSLPSLKVMVLLLSTKNDISLTSPSFTNDQSGTKNPDHCSSFVAASFFARGRRYRRRRRCRRRHIRPNATTEKMRLLLFQLLDPRSLRPASNARTYIDFGARGDAIIKNKVLARARN